VLLLSQYRRHTMTCVNLEITVYEVEKSLAPCFISCHLLSIPVIVLGYGICCD